MRFMSCIIFQIICHQNPNEKKKSYPDNNISGDSVKKFCTSQRLSISPFPHLRKVHIFHRTTTSHLLIDVFSSCSKHENVYAYVFILLSATKFYSLLIH